MSEEEFCERFIVHMLHRAGPTFDDGTSIAEYAKMTAPTYWEDLHMREDGPDACADADISYWGEE